MTRIRIAGLRAGCTGALPRLAISRRTIVIAEARGVLRAGRPWWFGSDVPAEGRRASVAMSGPLGCGRRIECDKEYLVAGRHRTGQVCAGAGRAGGRFT